MPTDLRDTRFLLEEDAIFWTGERDLFIHRQPTPFELVSNGDALEDIVLTIIPYAHWVQSRPLIALLANRRGAISCDLGKLSRSSSELEEI